MFCYVIDNPLAFIQTVNAAMHQKQEMMLTQPSFTIFKCEEEDGEMEKKIQQK